MGKYVKQFNTHSEYNTYITGNTKILPNVSYCEDNDEVHFNPWTDPRVIAKFNVEDVTEPVALYGADYGVIASELFSKVEIDGEEISISDLEDEDGYYTFETTGEHTVKYTLSDSEVISEGTFYDCSGLTRITIPNSVTSIGEYAFNGCIALTSINIPSSVTSIGVGTFNNCSGLTSITIPSNVTSIGDDAFTDCSGLTHITIPNSVISIGEYAFSGCIAFTSITIPSSVTSIGNGAFSDCDGLRSMSVESGNTVYDSRNNCNAIIETATNTLLCGCQNTIIPSSVTSIGSNAFGYCSSLTRITIPNSVTSIGDDAFRGCNSLTSITIPSNVTSIGSNAFGYCSSLRSISVESGNTVYDSRNNCNAIIETATNKLISGCQNTIIPSSVTSIGEYAFSGCIALTSINIPSGVTSIGSWTFQGCRGLTSVTIPSSVTNIGNSVFYGCSGLTSITSLAITAPTIQSNTFTNIKTAGTLYVLSGSTGYDVWMRTGNYYLGKYNWTKVEQ